MPKSEQNIPHGWCDTGQTMIEEVLQLYVFLKSERTLKELLAVALRNSHNLKSTSKTNKSTWVQYPSVHIFVLHPWHTWHSQPDLYLLQNLLWSEDKEKELSQDKWPKVKRKEKTPKVAYTDFWECTSHMPFCFSHPLWLCLRERAHTHTHE